MADARHQPIAPPDEMALEVLALSHFYGTKQALKDVSFKVQKGRFSVLLGLNGAGKTTLFSLLTRLYHQKIGQVFICGYDANRSASDALRRLGVVFQARTLDLDLSVRQNLFYHAALQGMSRSDAKVRIDELLRDVDLQERAYDKVRSLSGGQMRRVEIARSMLHRPKLLLLDEATVGLDVQSRASILRTIRNLIHRDGLSVLWATHLIDEVDLSDDLLILHQGELLAAGPAEEIIAKSGAATVESAFKHYIASRELQAGGRLS